MHLGDDLVGLQRGRKRTQEKVGGLDGACASLAGDGDLSVAGLCDARHFGGRVGMRQATPNSAAVANLIMRNMTDRMPEQRMRGRKPRVAEYVAPAHHGTESNAIAADLDLAQAG